MKRLIIALFVLISLGLVLNGCIIDDDSNSDFFIKSITVKPREIKKSQTGKSNEFFTVVVVIKDPELPDSIDPENSYPFVVKDNDEKVRGIQDSGTPVEKKGDKLTFKVAYTWVQDLPVGEHTVGIHLKLKNGGSIDEHRRDTGFITITN